MKKFTAASKKLKVTSLCHSPTNGTMRERYFVSVRCKLDELLLRTLEILSLSGMTSFNFILRPQKMRDYSI